MDRYDEVLLALEKVAYTHLNCNCGVDRPVKFISFHDDCIYTFDLLFEHAKFIVKESNTITSRIPDCLAHCDNLWLEQCFFYDNINKSYLYHGYYNDFKISNDSNITLGVINICINDYLTNLDCTSTDIVVFGSYAKFPPLLFGLQRKTKQGSVLTYNDTDSVVLPIDKDYLKVDASKLKVLSTLFSELTTKCNTKYWLTISRTMLNENQELNNCIPSLATYTYKIGNEEFLNVQLVQQYNILGQLQSTYTCGNITKTINH